MEIDKIQLLILTILINSGADSPGTGMTLKEIAKEVNKTNFSYSQMTINRKVWALRNAEYITSKIKVNKADMFYILAKGKSMKEVLFHGEQ